MRGEGDCSKSNGHFEFLDDENDAIGHKRSPTKLVWHFLLILLNSFFQKWSGVFLCEEEAYRVGGPVGVGETESFIVLRLNKV